jgi:hypothetical protein
VIRESPHDRKQAQQPPNSVMRHKRKSRLIDHFVGAG